MRLRECKIGMDVELLEDISLSHSENIPAGAYGKIVCIVILKRSAVVYVNFGAEQIQVSHLDIVKPKGLKDKPRKVKDWLPMPRKFLITYRSRDAYRMVTIEADSAIHAGRLSKLVPECIIGINKIN